MLTAGGARLLDFGLAMAALSFWLLTRPAPEALAIRLTADLPETARCTGAPTPGRAVALSPDGRWIAFFTATGELRKVPEEGGPAVTLVRGLLNGQWAFGA